MDSKLEAFEMWAYRRMLRVSWTEHKTTGSAISKYEHRQTSALLRNIRNIRICIEKKIFKPLYREKTVSSRAHKTAINRPMDHTGET